MTWGSLEDSQELPNTFNIGLGVGWLNFLLLMPFTAIFIHSANQVIKNIISFCSNL
jgi:hypothetical protein